MNSITNTKVGSVHHQIDVSQTNGQTIASVKSSLNGTTHETTISVGAVNGHDAISDMSDDELMTNLQNALDSARAEATKILTNRVRVSAIARQLT